MTNPTASPAAALKVPRSTTSPNDSPRGYADTVPDSHVFFPPENYRTGVKPSTAQAELKKKGIYSYDPILDKNPNELWRFLVSNLGQPHMEVHLVGTRTISTTGADQNMTTQTITDFSIKIDVSNYVIPEGSRITAHPSSSYKYFHDTSKPVPTLRETLEDYTSSDNPLKEFRVEKFVLWDYDRITQLLKDLVRSTGYRNRIAVSFPKQNYKVVAMASNRASRAAQSRAVHLLCVVSCLWIVCWPAWCMARKRVDRLVCEYGVAVSADEFVARNSERIQSSVKSRERFVSS